MDARISDIVKIMDAIAPPGLAEDWDNAGLQVGAADWPVRSIWVCLDPRPDIVDQAAEAGVDLLISHHPLIFKPLKSVDPSTPICGVIAKALVSRTAIFAAHTNLDSAAGGLNDILAWTIGLTDLATLAPSSFKTGGNEPEGLGRIGRLPEPVTLDAFANRVGNSLKNNGTAKVCGRSDLMVETVAVCSGSGSSLMGQFLSSGAQAYVTGDLRYHDALNALDADRGLIDVGHFASEVIVVDVLAERLVRLAEEAGLEISVQPRTARRDPFRPLQTP